MDIIPGLQRSWTPGRMTRTFDPDRYSFPFLSFGEGKERKIQVSCEAGLRAKPGHPTWIPLRGGIVFLSFPSEKERKGMARYYF